MPDQTPVTFERHAPEHGAAPTAAPAPAGCCCCCCCCLHTIGGLVGAIQGSVSPARTGPEYRNYQRDPNDIDAPFPFRRDAQEEEPPLMPVPLVYWLIVLMLCGATSFITYLNNGARDPSMLVAGGFIAVMILPALQLGASILTTLIVLIFYPNKGEPLTRIGKITLWSFVGTAVGMLAMAGCCGLFMLR